jgi:hypothetical protein
MRPDMTIVCDVTRLASSVVEAVYEEDRPYSICEVADSLVVHVVVAIVSAVVEAIVDMTGGVLSTVTVTTDDVAWLPEPSLATATMV